VLLGRIGRQTLEATDSSSIEEAMTLGPSTIRPSARLEPLLKRMHDHDLRGLPVTTSDGRLIGLLEREVLERRLHSDSNG
jgi:CBS domain-containing protein